MTQPDTQPQPITGINALLSKPQYLLRGGIIGACVTSFISWNSRKVSKIGIFYRKWKLSRLFIMPKKGPLRTPLTNYFVPPLNRVMNNFLCYSGQPGIGKSYHFQHFASIESKQRPVFYIKFKSIGDGFNFDKDISEQVGFGGHVDQGASLITDILNAAKRISQINNRPHYFWLKYLIIQGLFIDAQIAIYMSSTVDASLGMFGIFSLLGIHMICTNFMHPFLIQSIRRSIPLIILDDINKIESLQRLPQISRFLKLMQNNIGNVVLISSDEDTWAQLRKQPGLKDRLRLKQVKYNHVEVANKIAHYVQNNYQEYAKGTSLHPIYKKEVVIGLVQYLIGLRQITLRRFSSIMKLNDQEEYQRIIQVLQNKAGASMNQVIVRVADIFFETEMETMVANLKTVKRTLRQMSSQQFINSLNILLIKLRLPSDNPLGPLLQLYSIVREYRSQYIFNGRFMFTVYAMAVREYIKDIEEYQSIGAQLNKEKVQKVEKQHQIKS